MKKLAESPFITIREAARYLRLSYQSAYKLVRGGELPAHRIGRAWRIQSKDFEDFCKRSRFEIEVGEAKLNKNKGRPKTRSGFAQVRRTKPIGP